MKKLIRYLKEDFFAQILWLLMLWYVPAVLNIFFVMALGGFIWFIVDKYFYKYSWILEISVNIFAYSLAFSLFVGRTTLTEWSVDIFRNIMLIPFWEWSIWG